MSSSQTNFLGKLLHHGRTKCYEIHVQTWHERIFSLDRWGISKSEDWLHSSYIREKSFEILPKIVGNVDASINWQNIPGLIKPEQNQGSCGSCWAFAVIGALEGQMKIVNNVNNGNQKLSEQEILDWVSELGCNGGWDYDVWHHATKSERITLAICEEF